MTRVAIQGDPGAYSHVAARQLFGPAVEILPCRSFAETFEAVADGTVPRAVVPVENSLAGPVLESLDLLWKHEGRVHAETHVRVELCLAVPPGVVLSDSATVASHPVALRQCRNLFDNNPGWTPEAAFDTAGSVREMMAGESRHDGAIASALASELYGAEVVRRGVEDDPRNYTRFFEIAPAGEDFARAPAAQAVHAAMALVVPNRPGALSRALALVAEVGVDLTQIVARPIHGEPWHYRFYMEMRGESEPQTREALQRLGKVAEELRVFGLYDRR